MNKDTRIIDYLNGNLSEGETSQFESELAVDPSLRSEFENYSTLFERIDEIKVEQPSDKLKLNFEKYLESIEEKKDSQESKVITFRPLKHLKSIASVAAILIIGILVGINFNQSTQIKKMDNQTAQLLDHMKTRMESGSVSSRIEAMQVNFDEKNPQSEILNTLINTLRNDESPNVRLAAAEALEPFANESIVRSALVELLTKEKDSFVLISMIGTLSQSKNSQAKESLLEITKSENVEQFIRDEAHLGLLQLEKI